jgi:hypothetical protein
MATKIGDLGRTLMMETIRSSKMLVLTRATQCNIPEDGNLQIFIGFEKEGKEYSVFPLSLEHP